MNLEGFLLVVREKVKDETDATFSHVYDVFASQNGHFSHLSTKLKVNHAFKAKKEAFREQNLRKMENWPFWAHLTLQILDRDENHFLMNIFQNLVPNSNLRPLLAELKFHAPALRTEKHFPPAGPASTQEILIPCAGVAPPLQSRSYTLHIAVESHCYSIN